MQEFLQLIVDNWQIILEYVIMFVLYFFFGLNCKTMKNTKINLTNLVKENTEQANLTNNSAIKELKEAQAKYDAAVRQISRLSDELGRCKKALEVLLSEDVHNDRTTNKN